VYFLKRTEDQKLIYSGQLLHDSVTLKDILRRYEGQETHTVHLVCTPSRDSLRQASKVVTRAPSRMSDNGHSSATHSRGRYVLDLNVVFANFHVLYTFLLLLPYYNRALNSSKGPEHLIDKLETELLNFCTNDDTV
jgi:hypothetical protein